MRYYSFHVWGKHESYISLMAQCGAGGENVFGKAVIKITMELAKFPFQQSLGPQHLKSHFGRMKASQGKLGLAILVIGQTEPPPP